MQSEPKIGSPLVIALSWTAAIAAFPAALVAAIVGQGLGALAGGCHWVGFSLSLHRQVWALVNQPVLNFASLPSATGYWLGSLVLPAVLAAALIPLLPRKRSLTVELILVQVAWAASAVGIAWLSLIDRSDGHLLRWLVLHDLPPDVVWLAPMVAALTGLVPTLRLLALARRRPSGTGRLFRLNLVLLHFGVPTAVWTGVAILIGNGVPSGAIIAIATPLFASLVFAWFRFPPPFAHRLGNPSRSALVVLMATATVFAAAAALATRPRPDGRSIGFLWATPQASNNIRPWIDPTPLESVWHSPGNP